MWIPGKADNDRMIASRRKTKTYFSKIRPRLTVLHWDSSVLSRFLTSKEPGISGQVSARYERAKIETEEKPTKKGEGWRRSCKNTAKPISVKAKQRRGLLQLRNVGKRSKSGQINDLATTVQTDLNHNSWCRRGRTSVSCSIPTTVQQEPRDGALGCTYTGKKIKKDLIEMNGSHVVQKLGWEEKKSLKMFFPPRIFLPSDSWHKVSWNGSPEVDSKKDGVCHKMINDFCSGLCGGDLAKCQKWWWLSCEMEMNSTLDFSMNGEQWL